MQEVLIFALLAFPVVFGVWLFTRRLAYTKSLDRPPVDTRPFVPSLVLRAAVRASILSTLEGHYEPVTSFIPDWKQYNEDNLQHLSVLMWPIHYDRVVAQKKDLDRHTLLNTPRGAYE